jgi:hypothetical protein
MVGNRGEDKISGLEECEDEEELLVKLSIELLEFNNAGWFVKGWVNQETDVGGFNISK